MISRHHSDAHRADTAVQLPKLNFAEEMNSLGTGMISLKERLALLNKSADNWQARVKKDEMLLKKCSAPVKPRVQRVQSGKENKTENVTSSIGTAKTGTPINAEVTQAASMSKQSLLLNLDKGLDSFFLRSTTVIGEVPSKELDLDSVEQTDILHFPKRPRLKKPGKSRRVITDRLAALDTNTVKIEEDPRDYLVAPVIVDDGGPIAASARQGLQAKEDYTSVKNTLKQADTTSPYPPIMLIRVAGRIFKWKEINGKL
ncbi:unnamed protein product [Nippostrongylus brasiliensis]|uniref:Uncharacterized protein n=1 Tax=Nippostrongylus brasiliensis TaxID=27835 RepID=A0A158R076_NIPBR|nr:unnamed protein product [Nippostrongylus brasiliensis]